MNRNTNPQLPLVTSQPGVDSSASFLKSTKSEIRNPKQIQNSNVQNSKQEQHGTIRLSSFCFGHSNFGFPQPQVLLTFF
jgi:hypothetical protein